MRSRSVSQNEVQIGVPDWSRDGPEMASALLRERDPLKQVLFSSLLTVAERIHVAHKDWIRPPSRSVMTTLDLIYRRL